MNSLHHLFVQEYNDVSIANTYTTCTYIPYSPKSCYCTTVKITPNLITLFYSTWQIFYQF